MIRAFLLLSILFIHLLAAAAPDDAAIAARLKARLARSKLKSDGLQYRVQNGTVEWTGTVKIPQRKGAATRMAKTAGATKVVNRIAVTASANPATGAVPGPRRASVTVPRQ